LHWTGLTCILEKNSFFFSISLQPIKVEHLYGITADKLVIKKRHCQIN